MKHKNPSVNLEVGLAPDLVRIKRALAYSGFSQTLIYELMMRDEIDWFSVKLNKNQKRGIRYISLKSIDAYLARQAAASREQIASPSEKSKEKPTKETAGR